MGDGPVIRGLHHVAVRSPDLERSIRFYAEALGLTDVYRWRHLPEVPAAAFVAAGEGTHVELFGGGDPVTRREEDELVAHFALEVDDVSAAYERAVAAGARALVPPTVYELDGERRVEVTLAFVEGPSGERIELYRTTL